MIIRTTNVRYAPGLCAGMRLVEKVGKEFVFMQSTFSFSILQKDLIVHMRPTERICPCAQEH